MRKKILSSLAILAIAALVTLNVNLSTKSGNLRDFMLANIEALAQEGEGNPPVLWVRTDSDCVYEFTGKAGATITVFGITITFDASGNAKYTLPGGRTNCSSGGNELCTARYCPSLG